MCNPFRSHSVDVVWEPEFNFQCQGSTIKYVGWFNEHDDCNKGREFVRNMTDSEHNCIKTAKTLMMERYSA